MADSIQDLDSALAEYAPKQAAPDLDSMLAEYAPAPPAEPTPEPTLGDRAKDVGITALKGVIGVPETLVGAADLVSGGHAGKAVQEAGVDFRRAKEILSEQYSPAQKEAFKKVHEAEGFAPTLKAAVENPSVIAHTIGESLPSMAGGQVLAKGLMKYAPKLSSLAAGSIGEGAVTAGQNTEQLRQQTESGLLTPEQAGIQAASGALTGALTHGFGKAAQKLGVGDVNTLLLDNPALAATGKGAIRKGVEGGVVEGAQEAAQSGQEQAASNLALEKPLGEGVGNAAALGLVTGAGMGAPVGAIAGGNLPPPVEDAEVTAAQQAQTNLQEEPENVAIPGTEAQQAQTNLQEEPENAVIPEAPTSVEPAVAEVDPEIKSVVDRFQKYQELSGVPTVVTKSLKDAAIKAGVYDPTDTPSAIFEKLKSAVYPEKTAVEKATDEIKEQLSSAPDGVFKRAALSATEQQITEPQIAARENSIVSRRMLQDAAVAEQDHPDEDLDTALSEYLPAERQPFTKEVEDAGAIRSDQEFPGEAGQIREGSQTNSSDDLHLAQQESARGGQEIISGPGNQQPVAPEAPLPQETGNLNDQSQNTAPQTQPSEEREALAPVAQAAALQPQVTSADLEKDSYPSVGSDFQGVHIATETKAGDTRSGVDEEGQPWSVTMKDNYGFIPNVQGADKDHLDVFTPKNLTEKQEKSAKVAYVIDQNNPGTGEFDEHKVMLGYPTARAAKAAYLRNYSKGWKGFGGITEMPIDKFKEWLKTGDMQNAVSTTGTPMSESDFEKFLGIEPQFSRETENRTSDRRKTTDFLSPSEKRVAERRQLAREAGVKDEAAIEKIVPAEHLDAVTGFHLASDKSPTVEAAMEHVKNTGETAHFVEADIANLGGLNKHFHDNHEIVNPILRQLSNIFRDEMAASGNNAVFVRHGGDELSAVITGASNAGIQQAMQRTKARIADLIQAKGLDTIPNPKAASDPSKKPGVGIYLGQSPIVPGVSLENIYKRSSSELNAGKLGEEYVGRKQAETTRVIGPSQESDKAVQEEPVGSERPGRRDSGERGGADRAAKKERLAEATQKVTFANQAEAVAHLASDFGPGIYRLVANGVLNFTHGKETWPGDSGQQSRAEAVYGNGKAYVDLDATKKTRLSAVVLHEIGEHFNLRKMLGSKNYEALQNQVRNRALIEGSRAQRIWASVAKDYGDLEVGGERFVAEVIAKLGEESPKSGWFRRILSQIKSFLVRLGLGKGFLTGKMTEDDLHDLLRVSLKSAVNRDPNEARVYGEQFSRGAEGHGLAPNGKPSNLNPVQYAQVRTPEFKKWFGDWENDPENASKVVDANGEPLVVYHGTNRDFTEFRPSKYGANGPGIYLTTHKGVAGGHGDKIIEAYARITNSKEGAIAGHEIIVKSPENVKSATENTGEFNPEDSDIRFSRPSTEAIPENVRDLGLNIREKFRNMSSALASEKLAFLSTEQVIEIAKDYLPSLKEYGEARVRRRALIDSPLRKADQTLSKWKKLSKIHIRAVGRVMQSSTMHDVNASKAWAGVEQVAGGFKAYTQTTLNSSSQTKLRTLANTSGAVSTDKNSATFRSEKAAKDFVAKLNLIDQDQTAFRAENQYKDDNTARKIAHQKVKPLYEALPEAGKEVYAETYAQHTAIFAARLAALEERIKYAIVDAETRKALIAQLRQKFESQSLSWYYAPFKRYGDFWMYGTDNSGQKWFKTYQSEKSRDEAIEEFKKQGGTEIRQGKSLRDMQNMERELGGISDNFILDVNNAISRALPPELGAAGAELQDDIYQMYLATLPDVSIRHNSMHRKGTLGFDEDAMRAFAGTIHHGASQLANMTEGRVMEQVLKDTAMAIELSHNPGERQKTLDENEAAQRLLDDWENLSPEGVIEDALSEAINNEDSEEEQVFVAMKQLRNKFSNLDDPSESLIDLMHRNSARIEAADKISDADRSKAVDALGELSKSYKAMVGTNSTLMDQVAAWIRQFDFIWTMAFGLSSGIVNLFQTPVVAIPVAAGKYGAAKATSKFGSAASDYTKAVVNGFKTDANGDYLFRDADGNVSVTKVLEHRRDALRSTGGSQAAITKVMDEINAIETFKEEGTVSRTQSFDVIGIGQEGETYGGKLHDLSKKMGWMVHHGERTNREVTLLGAYRLAREGSEGVAPMNHVEALDYARWVNNRSHGDYSTENAARIFRGWPAGIALQYKKYPQMMLFLWGKTAADMINGWRKLPEGPERELAKKQAKEAARTLGGLFVMQGAVAGAFGMPLMGMISVVLNALGAAASDDDEPWDIQKEVRVGLTKLGGEAFATALTKGLVNAATPINLASRMDLSHVMFQEPMKELEGRDASTNYIAQVAGPFGGMIGKLAEGAKLLGEGEILRGAETATPKAIGDILKASRFATEDARTLNGDLLKDVSVMETLFQLAGFGNSNLETLYTERNYVKGAEAALQEARQKAVNKVARAALAGEEVPLDLVKEWNKKHPTWPIAADNIHRSMVRIRQNEQGRGSRGYAVNPKLEYLYEKYGIREEAE